MKKVWHSSMSFRGSWHTISFEDAMRGAIGYRFLKYTENKKDGFIFYGISMHHQKEGFKYFIGTEDEQGTFKIDESNYLVEEHPVLAYETYLKMAKESVTFKAFGSASFMYDPIPVKIEKYRYQNNEVYLETIMVPIE